MTDDPFLSSQLPLRPTTAVAAFLMLDGTRYVMQRRDSFPHIFYPGFWGCFGGAIEPGESDMNALMRELKEELALDINPASVEPFTTFTFDYAFCGLGVLKRVYFEAAIDQAQMDRFVVGEGQGVRAFTGEEILSEPRLAPYDAFALWLHFHRHRLGP